MKALPYLATTAAVLALAFPGLAVAQDNDAEKESDGWVALLDGDSLDEHWMTTGNWKLEDGVATLTPRPGESGWSRWSAYLWSKESFKDFEVKFDYKVETNGNSGFYFRVGDRDDPVAQGIEVQIYDSASQPEDKPLNDHDSGGVIPGVAPTKRAAKPAGEWNQFHITVKNDQLTIVLNGETVNEIDLSEGALASRPKEGPIGFQDHGLPLHLRDIRIRKISE
ncbi:DUF1080 domain-containing protein [soil metagenome]